MNFTNLKHLKVFDKLGFVTMVKFAIVLTASFVIYSKLGKLSPFHTHAHIENVFLILLLSVCNWHFEILKWKRLATAVRSISYLEALAQSLAAHTAAVTTPNKLGEYGAKAYFFKHSQPKKIMGLNFIGNAYQLLTTLCFGTFGMFVYLENSTSLPFHPWMVLTIYGALLLASLVFVLFTKSYQKYLLHFKEIGFRTHLLAFTYSCIRYVLFSSQFFLVLHAFEPQITYFEITPVIWCMYLIASFIPSFSLVDFAVKGSVALVLFSSFHLEELSVVSTALFMWVCNFAVPAVLGMYFVFRTQPYKPVSA